MSLLEQLRLEKRFLSETLHYWMKLRKYNASSHTLKDMEKMQYTLLRLNHTVEKGLSMRNPRIGFGQQKVSVLLDRLLSYAKMYKDQDALFLQYPISTISNYIDYTEKSGVDIPDIKDKFEKLLKICNLAPSMSKGGIFFTTKESVQKAAAGNFESLLFSRHSMRYFLDELPSHDLINKALELAQRTPSACNRQGWKTHVFMGEKSVELVQWQGGSRGFEDEIKCSILVTANLKAFLDYEVHQAYVDGGLYAMNLINAIHYLGLGCIPLSTGFRCQKLDELNRFGIPENEVPILIVGVGYLPDEYKVAVSERKNISITNTYHI